MVEHTEDLDIRKINLISRYRSEIRSSNSYRYLSTLCDILKVSLSTSCIVFVVSLLSLSKYHDDLFVIPFICSLLVIAICGFELLDKNQAQKNLKVNEEARIMALCDLANNQEYPEVIFTEYDIRTLVDQQLNHFNNHTY